MPLSTPIIQIIDRDPISVDIDQKVSDALRILTSGRFNHLPIIRSGKLVGLLSTTDMLELKASTLLSDGPESVEFADKHYELSNIMSKDVISVSDRATVGDAATQLSAGGFHSLPVVDREDRLVGIVTTTDLINHMLDGSPEPAMAASTEKRLRALERVYKVAQAFLHSGMAAQEHHKLELALNAIRESDTEISL